ncbi:Transposase [Cordylochernes scorpioides]|uniref:Transposase n=1 Tax=Cordylochernes scorpioides TaxID=51811 RepID=A0ABY6K4I4_9ARAC|nr:Transposase [Cordylochernes scorpioides]
MVLRRASSDEELSSSFSPFFITAKPCLFDQIETFLIYSPDLSPIEHVWDIIGRRLHALPQPRSEDELWQMVEREWRAIPQDAIRTLIDSLPSRVAACIAVRGGPTCY